MRDQTRLQRVVWVGAALIVAALGAFSTGRVTAEINASSTPAFAPEKLRGLVVPRRQVLLKAPLDGLVESVDVQENDVVRKGQILFTMDRKLQKALVDVAALEIEKYELTLKDAQLQVGRLEQLLKTSAAHEWEVLKRKVERDLAAVAVRHAQRSHDLELTRLERHQLVSPFDGVVVRLAAHAGASLRQGEDVLSVLEIDPLEASLFLPVEFYGKLKIGEKYRFEAGAPVNDVIEAEMKTFEPIVDSASQTFRCVFTIANDGLKFPTGFPIKLIWSPDAR